MQEKTPQQPNRIREALGRLYEHHPPHFREYLRRYQEDPTSRVFAPLAEAYRRLGRVEEAIDICKSGLAHHPEFHGGRVALARCYIDKKLLVEAKEELEKVIQISPENLLAQRLLAECFVGLGDFRQALHCYKMAVLLAPDDVALHEKVFQLERKLGGDPDLQSAPEFKAPPPLSAAEMASPQKAAEAVREIHATLDAARTQAALAPARTQGLPQASRAPEPLPAAALESLESNELDSFDAPQAADEAALLPAAQETEGEGVFEDPHESELRRARVDAILGVDAQEQEGDAFKIEAVNNVFAGEKEAGPEITTQTLGDLYYSQGQFEKSLRIFEKLNKFRPSPELSRKINECRSRLGVDAASRIRQRQIDMLNDILQKNKALVAEARFYSNAQNF